MRTTTRSGWLGARKTALGCAVVALSLASWASAEAAVLKIAPAGAEIVSEDIVARTKAIKSVRKVERYLLIKASPHQVIGVEGDAPLRVITPDGGVVEATLETGKKFRKEDDGKPVAIVGTKVYAEDYGYRGSMGQMARMKHLLEVGQTFKLTGEAGPRVRVLGTLAARPEAAEKVFLPLSTAQKLFDRAGQVSHLFVAVDGDAEAAAKALQAALGSSVEVSVASR